MFLRHTLAPLAMATILFPASSLNLCSAQRAALKSNVPSGDGGLATKASITYPGGLAIDQEGNLFIVESYWNTVRRVDAGTQIITTVAGDEKHGFSGDGGLATKTSLEGPQAVVVDKNGNLYISEISGRVRRVDAITKIINTAAGNGEMGLGGGTGDGGPATLASLRVADDLAFDSQGNLYIADDSDHRIRRVDIKTGIITTVAGGGSSLGDGMPAIQAGLHFPTGIAFDRQDNMFIAEYQNHRIRRVDARTKIITTVAGNGINAYRGDGGLAINASIRYPSSITVDDHGNLFFVDGADRVRRVDGQTGIITTLAGNGEKGFTGDGGLASKAWLYEPSAVTVDSAGNIFIAEYVSNRVRRVDAVTGIITTIAGGGPLRLGLANRASNRHALDAQTAGE